MKKHIGLVKKEVSKDLQATDSSVALWDCCVERRLRIMIWRLGIHISYGGKPLRHTDGNRRGCVKPVSI